MASNRFARGDLKARLWEISWMARKRFWFAVAPITYAVVRNFHDRSGVSLRSIAQRVCKETTAATTYLVSGSGPQSLVICANKSIDIQTEILRALTSGCAFMIACLLVRCGSSVYVQKKSCPFTTSVEGAFAFFRSSSPASDCRQEVTWSLADLKVTSVEVEGGMLRSGVAVALHLAPYFSVRKRNYYGTEVEVEIGQ